MTTPQEIREKTFEKAVFGGYDMGDVDDFMEQIATDMTELQKENAMLKGKMKVLVDKIEEYRSGEEALRSAILSAQKMGNMIEKESREKSEKLLNDTLADAERLKRQAESEVEAEKARLESARRSSAQFIENMNLLCHKQLEFLEKISGTDFVSSLPRVSYGLKAAVVRADDGPEMHETVKSIEETVAKAASEPVSDVHPDIKRLVTQSSDNRPTRTFGIIHGGAGDDAETTLKF